MSWLLKPRMSYGKASCPAWNSTLWRTLFLLPTPFLTRLQPLRSFSSLVKARDDAADETALPIAHHRRGWCPFLTSTSTPPQNPSPIQAVWYWIPNKTAHNSELDGWLRWNAFHIEIVLIFEMNFGMTVCGPELQSIIIAFLNWNYAILNLHMLP